VPTIKPGGAPDEAAWARRQTRLADVDNWRLDGRVAVINGSDGNSGSLVWRQQADALEFRISGPFGVGGMHIYGDARGVKVVDSRGRSFFTRSPDFEFYRRFGWYVPLESLRYWVVGLPDPGLPSRHRVDAGGRLETLEQEGFHVAYLRYMTVSGLELPQRITVTRGAIKVKVAVQDWSLDPAGQPAAVEEQAGGR
jgi:outer membrane lipoprotein LolB